MMPNLLFQPLKSHGFYDKASNRSRIASIEASDSLTGRSKMLEAVAFSATLITKRDLLSLLIEILPGS